MIPKDLFIYFAQFNDITEINKLWKLNKMIKQYFDNPYAKKIFLNAINKKYCDTVNNNLCNCVLMKDYFLINHFIDKGATYISEAMLCAVENNNMDIVNLMIEKGADDYWDIALCSAAQNNHLDMVNFLIEKGADDFNLAMTGAAYNNNYDMVNFLIKKGATNFDWALRWAVIENHIDIIRLLIQNGGNYNLLKKKHKLALHNSN